MPEQEAQWVRRTAAGDRAAFEALYLAFHPRLYRFAVAQGVANGGEDEVINDVMHVVWKRAATFDGSSRASTWIFGIALNKVRAARRAHSRSSGRWRPIDDLEPADATAVNGANGANGEADLAAGHQRRTDLQRALAQLGPDHRTALELAYFEGLSYREIAAIMECPENTVKTRVFHARRHLARLLGDEPPEDPS